MDVNGETDVTPAKQAVDVAVEALRYLVLAVQREGDRMLVGILRPFGLTPSQAEVIAVLAEYAPISLAELGRLLVCEAGSPSRLVDSLVRKGLVYRRHSRTDRRSVQLQLTSAGFTRLASLQVPADAIIQAVAQRLDPDERITLATLLSKLLVGLPTEGVIARRFGWPPDEPTGTDDDSSPHACAKQVLPTTGTHSVGVRRPDTRRKINMQLLDLTADELLSTTRSVRRRLDLERPVEPEVIDECLRIALQAPTGSNAQNWHWVVITDQGLRTAIAEYYRTSFTAYITTSRRAIATIADPDRQASQLRVASSAQYLADNLHRVPVFVLGCLEGDPQGYPAWQLPAYWGSL
ncbi:MarR family transcriptional regulator, partial [Frankia sp. Cr1]|uniref:MarR family transcriptional regulator n=1 Tax=Frankia sp. Cr1 TaxID=3073931 RepID=UPI002AD4F975